MKRFTVLGLCLIASLALSAMVAAGAQAAKAEHGPLVVESKGGLSEFGGGGKGALHSPENVGSGEFKNSTQGTAVSTFHGVELESTGLKCTSAGQAAGDVKTFELSEETGWIKSPTEAGVDFKPAKGEELAAFSCGPVTFKVFGSVVGQTSPINVSSKTSKLDLRPNGIKTANNPEKFEKGPKDTLESETNQAPGKNASYQQQENVTVTNHGNSTVCKVDPDNDGPEKCKAGPAETNTIANPARPEIGRCVKQSGGKFADANCTTPPTKKGKYEFVPIPG